MPIRSSSMGGTPFGNTANRPSSPQIGQTYYNGELGYLEIYTSAGWTSAVKAIPFGNTSSRPANPQIGQPYFNGQESRLELYTTTTGWQNIVQETPAVVNVVGQLNETASSTIQINGTNFAAGAVAYVVGTNGVETAATTTSLVSVVEISAVFPGLSASYEPYDVKVVNPSNLYGVLYETLSVNNVPVWSTAAGSLGTFTELQSVSVTVAATDTTDSTNSPLSYSVVSGSLPPGLSLSSAGIISGTLSSNVITNTTYSFTIAATDGRNTAITRAFSITINDRDPIWSTGTTLPTFTRNVAYSTTVAATEDDSGAITYSLVSGSLPTGLSLSSSGVISGIPTSSTNASFTARATVTASGTTADRTFNMPNTGPVWTTFGTIGYTNTYSYQLVATDDSGISPTYSIASGTLPTGLSLSPSGLITGSTSSTGSPVSVTFRATDQNGQFSNQTLSFTLPLYSFSSHTFTTAGRSLATGPSLAEIQSAYSSASWAQNSSYLNMTTNGYQKWTVPVTGQYTITAAGARGNSGSGNGGSGAVMSGNFNLIGGEYITVAVGQMGGVGSAGGGSGGGGSFVYRDSSSSPLIVAGGGGGGGDDGAGISASLSTSGNSDSTSNNSGGSNGSGGQSGGDWGGSGGGGITGNGNGGRNSSTIVDSGGRSYTNGLTNTSFPSSYGAQGGFGGGGATSWAPGGGGGYSGGAGRFSNGSGADHGGGAGGGSYNIGTSQSNTISNNSSGYVSVVLI